VQRTEIFVEQAINNINLGQHTIIFVEPEAQDNFIMVQRTVIFDIQAPIPAKLYRPDKLIK
jgi:hypothetical protein